ncbi:Ferredoxin reductase [Legionella steigerwaltii]|uniref:Ferredoxin reductase n=1 Tax=Legionella steigerwaltii TaxID=460 RepID=A0A378L6N7_9GAMM|nr:FAD-dependent oxidoreductase [Legionella steigerwaltii]KTD80312.1 Phospholipase, patatin family [Legionella steigerwaltii]STY22394.1 Ferredoxin reductase [Legionella steigerwaltii]
MTKTVDFLLIGGGLSCAFAADTLRKEGAYGNITILSEESFLPYFRPQLPRGFLLGTRTKDELILFNEDYYKKNDIEVLLNTKALSVDPENKIVKTDHAGDFNFKQLLIATGCSAQRINLPGSKLDKIYYLKTILDAQPILHEIENAKKVVILGGSFIGIEIASLLMKKNIEVTIITEEFHLFNVSSSAEVAAFITHNGVEVLLNETVKKINGKTHVHSVETNTGKILSCDFVIITDKYDPDIDFLQGSGIEVDDGIIVDQYLQTNKKDIYASGDVANFFDPVFRRCHRNGGVDNAIKQGKIAALNMMGMRKSYHSASYFNLHAFDTYIVIIGDTTEATERIVRGSVREKNCTLFYLKDGLLQGAFFSGRPIEEIKAAESLIINRVNIEEHKKNLFDINFSLEEIAVETVLTLQGGGALGAFECGVVKAMEEHGIYPDIVSGISIGAFNSAIIAGNPKHATEALESFWNDLALDTLNVSDEQTRRLFSSWQAMIWGSPNFFHPRWTMPIFSPEQMPTHWTSFYDTSYVKDLLRKYIDFDTLKDSPVRLLVMAVNVETSEFETFDSYTDNITPEHILASGSLPPGFPWTTINNKHYWDGGIITNTPIDSTLDICGRANKKIYIVELYSRNRSLPQNMIEVLSRKDEILFSEKIRKDIHNADLINNYKKLIEQILRFCDPKVAEEIRQLPAYIQAMGDASVQSITRIIREVGENEPYAWDSDFSRETLEQLKKNGYKMAKKILEKESLKKPVK